MENGIKTDAGDKLGKTIIFAYNKKHAQFIVDTFDEMYPHRFRILIKIKAKMRPK